MQDLIAEKSSEGTDTVLSSVTYYLPDEVEKITPTHSYSPEIGLTTHSHRSTQHAR